MTTVSQRYRPSTLGGIFNYHSGMAAPPPTPRASTAFTIPAPGIAPLDHSGMTVATTAAAANTPYPTATDYLSI